MLENFFSPLIPNQLSVYSDPLEEKLLCLLPYLAAARPPWNLATFIMCCRTTGYCCNTFVPKGLAISIQPCLSSQYCSDTEEMITFIELLAVDCGRFFEQS